MKKKEKKHVKAKQTKAEKDKKQRSSIIDMMRRDREACAKKDKKLAELGIKKEYKDIVKDNPCYGCSFAMEAVREGPFDPPFVCAGIPRIQYHVKCAQSGICDAITEFVASKRLPRTILCEAQFQLIKAVELISRLMVYNHLDCVSEKDYNCFRAIDSLQNFLKK